MTKIIKDIKTKNLLTQLIIAVFLSLFLISCSEDVTPSLWVEKPKGETPVITQVEPAGQGLAGVTTITINGANFSDNNEHNIVYFNSAVAEILESTSSKLVVRAPNLVSDEVDIKIAVRGVELFSDPQPYKLVAAVSELYPFKSFERPYALTTDKDNNLYFSFVSEGIGKGIKKLSPDGTITDFAPKGGETFYNSIKIAADGSIYGVRNVRAIFRVTEGNKPKTFQTFPSGTSLRALDLDENQNIWTGGIGGKIFSVTPSKTVTAFDFAPKVTHIRVYNGYVYVTAETDDNEEAVWRFKINSASDLGAAEKVFDYSANYDAIVNSLKAVTFSADGVMYLGTDGDHTMIRVETDGSFSEWYPDLMESPVFDFAWGTGTELYYTRNFSLDFSQQIIRVDMEQLGAPYHGRD